MGEGNAVGFVVVLLLDLGLLGGRVVKGKWRKERFMLYKKR
jgi:hypothetical protein